MRIGLISDTHGLLRPEALAALQGSDHIIHGGDIGAASILQVLREIAPVTAVRGNNDTEAWALDIPDTAEIVLGGVRLFVLHDAKALPAYPHAAGAQVVVCGHSHRPLVQPRPGGGLLVNPGSAGRRRFTLPITVAALHLEAGNLRAEVIALA